MTYAVNSQILAADYNTFVTNVNSIYSTGTGQSGYGQTGVTLSSVAAGNNITAAQWANLRTAILACANHQATSTALLPPSGDFVAGSSIKAYVSTYDLPQMITDITTNKLVADVGSMTATSKLTSTRATSWSTQVIHELTVDFTSENNARYYFNSGGEIRFTGSRTGGSVSNQNTDWTNLLSTMGTIKFNYTQTSQTGSGGTTSTIGYYDLTGVYQQVFTQPGTAPYGANDYTIYARRENYVGANGGNGSLVRFKIEFNDDYTGGSDSVDGTLTSTITQFKATTYLTISDPTYTTVTGL